MRANAPARCRKYLGIIYLVELFEIEVQSQKMVQIRSLSRGRSVVLFFRPRSPGYL